MTDHCHELRGNPLGSGEFEAPGLPLDARWPDASPLVRKEQANLSLIEASTVFCCFLDEYESCHPPPLV